MVEDDLIGPCGGASVACAGGVYLVPGSPCSRRCSPNCVLDLWLRQLLPFLFLLVFSVVLCLFASITLISLSVCLYCRLCISRMSLEPPGFRKVQRLR